MPVDPKMIQAPPDSQGRQLVMLVHEYARIRQAITRRQLGHGSFYTLTDEDLESASEEIMRQIVAFGWQLDGIVE